LVTTVSSGSEQLLVMLQFFVRATSNYQGAIILAERGMTVEARILARACLETALYALEQLVQKESRGQI
jgi:hypothetical protein